jgi:hypothetical protein
MRRTRLEGLTPPLAEALTDDAELGALAAQVRKGSRAKIGRGLAIQQVDAGSCNG